MPEQAGDIIKDALTEITVLGAEARSEEHTSELESRMPSSA